METRALGELKGDSRAGTGRDISVLGLGAAGIGNLYGELTDEDGAAVVRVALDLGITYIDTAPLYGRGLSERRIGLALRDHPRAADCLVATKIGYVPDDFDYSFDATVRSVEASLERLGLARLPLVQIHEMRPEIWDAVMRPGGALAALRRCQDEGLVEHVGVTGSDLATVQRAIETDEFATVLLWRHYHLLDHSGEAVLHAAARRGMGIVVGTPFAGGILATGNTDAAKFFYRDAPPAERVRVERIAAIAADYGVPLAAVALHFCLRGPGVTTVIAGADTPAHVAQNVAMLKAPVPEDLWADLERIERTP